MALELQAKARLLASAGTKAFKVLFSYKDGNGTASRTVLLKYVRDENHARDVFKGKIAPKYENPKITRVTED